MIASLSTTVEICLSANVWSVLEPLQFLNQQIRYYFLSILHHILSMQVDTALDWVGDVTPPPPGRVPVAGSVEEALRGLNDETQSGNRDAVMHNLCLFTVRTMEVQCARKSLFTGAKMLSRRKLS